MHLPRSINIQKNTEYRRKKKLNKSKIKICKYFQILLTQKKDPTIWCRNSFINVQVYLQVHFLVKIIQNVCTFNWLFRWFRTLNTINFSKARFFCGLYFHSQQKKCFVNKKFLELYNFSNRTEKFNGFRNKQKVYQSDCIFKDFLHCGSAHKLEQFSKNLSYQSGSRNHQLSFKLKVIIVRFFQTTVD